MTETKNVHTSRYDGYDRRESVDNIDWHQTKGLSLSIIILLIVNIVSTVWWAATLTNDVTQIKERPDLTERVIKLEAVTEEYQKVLGRVVTIIDNVERRLNRVDKEQARRLSIIQRIERGK
jgi:uncharacterized iron-regulated membrane protein